MAKKYFLIFFFICFSDFKLRSMNMDAIVPCSLLYQSILTQFHITDILECVSNSKIYEMYDILILKLIIH